MKDLNEATEKICALKGTSMAQTAFIAALFRSLPRQTQVTLQAEFASEAEVARVVLLNELVSQHVIDGFDHDVQNVSTMMARHLGQEP